MNYKNLFKIIITTLSTITIALVLTGCGKSQNQLQKEFLKNSKTALLNEGYEIEDEEIGNEVKNKPYSYYLNVSKLTDKQININKIKIMSFKDTKLLAKFNKQFNNEIKNYTDNSSKSIKFTMNKLDEEKTIYTSTYPQQKKRISILIVKREDINTFIAIEGVGKLEKENKTLTKQLVALYNKLLNEHKKKKDTLPNKQRKILVDLRKYLKTNKYDYNLTPYYTNKDYNIQIDASKALLDDSSGYYKISANMSNKNIKEQKINKYPNEISKDYDYKGFKVHIANVGASNGQMSELIATSNDNLIIVKITYRNSIKGNKKINLSKNLDNILKQIVK